MARMVKSVRTGKQAFKGIQTATARNRSKPASPGAVGYYRQRFRRLSFHQNLPWLVVTNRGAIGETSVLILGT